MNPVAIWNALIGLPRWAHLLMGAVALAGAALLWLQFHDRGVVKKHEAGVSAQVAETVTHADRTAISADQERARQRATDSAETKGAIANAQAKHPDEVRRAAGPATNAAADSLRKRTGQDRGPAR